MPTPLTWDSPGLTWDSGATWDGMAPSKRKSMENVKAIIDFSRYSDAELSPNAQTIHDALVTNAATFPSPPISVVALQTLISTYDGALSAKASKASADVLAFKEAREELLDALRDLGNYVNMVAKGDPAIVILSGFPSYSTARTTDNTPPAAPANLRLKHGELSGTIVARYKPESSKTTNEVQTNTGDPNVAADWHVAGMFQGGTAELEGLTPGAVVWVRVRTVGLKGVMGAWSDPGQIRVL